MQKFSFKKFNHLKAIKFTLFVCFFTLATSLFVTNVIGSTLDNLNGAAWGLDKSKVTIQGLYGSETVEWETGAQWISFNCLIDNHCADSNYGVNLDFNTKELKGYAYSANYGWLKFGGMNINDMPPATAGNGTYRENAKLYDIGGGMFEVRGWARFCNGAANKTLCSGNPSGNDIERGGWDGWISLNGISSDTKERYRVLYNSVANNNGQKVFSGYGWGGNYDYSTAKNVVGWLDFNNVYMKDVSGPTVTIYAKDSYIPQNGSTTIYWDSLNTITDPAGCEATEGANSKDTGDWAKPNPPKLRNSPNGSFNTGVLANTGDYIYEIRCKGTNGNFSTVASATVHVGIKLFLNSNTYVAYPPEYTIDLSWYSDAPLSDVVPPDKDYCVAEYSKSNQQPNDPKTYWNTGAIKSLTNSQYVYNFSIKNTPDPVRFDLVCYDGNTPISAPPIYVSKAVNEQLVFGNTKVTNEKTTLFWETYNMASCKGTTTLTGQEDNWTGDKAFTNGYHSQADVNVPTKVPSQDFEYNIECTGLSGKTYKRTLILNSTSDKKIKYKEN